MTLVLPDQIHRKSRKHSPQRRVLNESGVGKNWLNFIKIHITFTCYVNETHVSLVFIHRLLEYRLTS